MTKFDPLRFIADHAGMALADAILEAYRQGQQDAQPEIIYCKDCRWQKDQSGSTAWLPCRAIITPSDFYCGRAERKTDEQT